MQRDIVIDTETTGLEVSSGHRIIEIGAIELDNYIRTGQHFHFYINPERPIDTGATAVHGITNERLKDEPVFADIVDKFLDFIGDARLVIHNAVFDMGFINAELERVKKPSIEDERVIDTLSMARRKFPGAHASLDALCQRFGIDNTMRELHGAMLDAELLVDVYVELIGGKQPDLIKTEDAAHQTSVVADVLVMPDGEPRTPRDFPPSVAELDAHEKFLETIPSVLWSSSRRE